MGKNEFRLTPEKIFIIALKSNKPSHKTVKVEFLKEPFPKNIRFNPDSTLPLEFKTEQASKNSYIISMSIGPEQLRDTSTGMIKGELAIIPEGDTELAPITLPVSLFLRE